MDWTWIWKNGKWFVVVSSHSLLRISSLTFVFLYLVVPVITYFKRELQSTSQIIVLLHYGFQSATWVISVVLTYRQAQPDNRSPSHSYPNSKENSERESVPLSCLNRFIYFFSLINRYPTGANLNSLTNFLLKFWDSKQREWRYYKRSALVRFYLKCLKSPYFKTQY